MEQATPGIMRMLELAGPGGLPGVQPETAPLLRDHAQQDWRDVVARPDELDEALLGFLRDL